MSVFKPVYAASANITCTLASLAASSTVGRSSAVVDNTTNLYQDVLVFLGITTGSGTPGGNLQVAVYAYANDGSTNYEEEESNVPGTDASYTINSPSIFRLAAVIPTKTASKVYQKSFTLARLWGGVLPPKWGLIVCNDTGQTFAASGFLFEYIGINATYS